LYDLAIPFSESEVMSENVHNSLIKRAKSSAWWHMPVNPALGRLTEEDWIFLSPVFTTYKSWSQKKMNPQKITQNGSYLDVHQSMWCVHT
jgi:hypothetical protein